MKQKSLLAIVLLLLCVSLMGCKSERAEKKLALQTITATMQAVPTQMYYSGTVNPIQVFNISSPTDGVVKSLFFKYGDRVNANDKLLIVSSTKLQQDYAQALTDFIKAKEEYNNQQINYHGTEELYKAYIISKQEDLQDKEQYDTTLLSYLTAKNTLDQIIKKIPGSSEIKLEQLTAEDVNTISSILASQSHDVPIFATTTGIALTPPKGSGGDGADDGSGGGSKDLAVGSSVKASQILLALGDLSGISTTVQVGELVINRIKPGQKVTVSLEALPNITLQGEVKSVGAQAQAAGDSQSSVATFPVTVVVPKLTPEEIQQIRVGMTAKIQITIANPAHILVPINAVSQGPNGPVVTLLNKAGKPQVVPVVTGPTTEDQVAIIKGIKEGDKVVVPSQ